MAGSPREHLEIDLGMRVAGDHVNGGAVVDLAQRLPAQNQGLGAQQAAGVDAARRPAKALWNDGRRLFVRRW